MERRLIMRNYSFSACLSDYLNNYLVIQRNMSPNTIRSYKCTFKLLIKYILEVQKIAIKNIDFNILTKDLIKNFLEYLETENKISANTRNQRLAAIKAFFMYVKDNNPEILLNTQQILSIKCKKSISKIVDYLTKEELKQLLDVIPTDTRKGVRNLTLLSLMYDSAGRAEEIVKLKVSDLRLDSNPIVNIFGKGKKYRTVPITNNTKELLVKYVRFNNIDKDSILFPNAKNNYCSTKMIAHMIDKYSKLVGFIDKNIHPHTFRHTRAMHLLESGINLIYIRDFLGHSSIETTEVYAKVNENLKREAISNAYTFDVANNLSDWNNDKNLLNELLGL